MSAKNRFEHSNALNVFFFLTNKCVFSIMIHRGKTYFDYLVKCRVKNRKHTSDILYYHRVPISLKDKMTEMIENINNLRKSTYLERIRSNLKNKKKIKKNVNFAHVRIQSQIINEKNVYAFRFQTMNDVNAFLPQCKYCCIFSTRLGRNEKRCRSIRYYVRRRLENRRFGWNSA